jgi:hypothetical protein
MTPRADVDAALEALSAARHPHLVRYRELTADSNPDPESREGYRQLVVSMVAGGSLGGTFVPKRHVAVSYHVTDPAKAAKPCGGCPGL